MQSLQPAFAIRFPGTVWRVVADPGGTLLIVEIVGEGQPGTHFAAVALPAGKLLWQQWNPAVHGLAHAVALQGETLYVQIFSAGPLPQPEALLAIDVPTRSVLWQRPKASWGNIAGEGVTVREVGYERVRCLLLHPRDGTIKREVSPAEVALPEAAGLDAGRYPVHYTEGDPYTKSIAEFIQDRLGVTPAWAFDYAEKQHVLIISYYLYQANQYDNFLAVFDRKGLPLWGQKIAGALPGTGLNTFLTTDNLLIFVQEKNQLLGYVL
ncbi:MAG TPA: hypothetical protein VF646_03530 [Cytophagales bacterium]|jgi:hypothetical protein